MADSIAAKSSSPCRSFMERFHAAGFVLIELRGQGEELASGEWATGKEPVSRAWQKTTASPALPICLSWLQRGRNYGFLPGASGLAVLDIEPAGLDLWPLEWLPSDAMIVRTPSGGLHVYLELGAVERVLGRQLGKQRHGDKAELFGRSGQVVGPGCSAWSNKARRVGMYQLERDGTLFWDDLALRRLLKAFFAEAGEVAAIASSSLPSSKLSNGQSARGHAALSSASERVIQAAPGTRHSTLLREASSLGSLVARGELDEARVREALENAAQTGQPDQLREAKQAIADGVAFGLAHPRAGPPHAAARRSGAKSDQVAKARSAQRIVVCDGELPRVVEQLEQALADSHFVFAKGQVLVTPIRLEKKRSTAARRGEVTREGGALVTPPATSSRLIEIAMRQRSIVKRDKSGERSTDLALKYATTLLDRSGDWPLIPSLRGIAECPILRSDGSIAQMSGYDEASGFLLALSEEFPHVPDHPGRADAESCAGLLLSVVDGFPYVDDNARAAGLSGLLTPLARPAMRTAPLFLFDAPKQRTGKTLHVDLVALLATGRAPAITPPPQKEEEFDKLLLAVLVEGDPIVVLDNVEHPLRSAKLAAALTAETYRGRILGLSKTATIPVAATFYATGNNIRLAGDLASRGVVARLDSGLERPEERAGFKVPDLRAHVLEHRVELVVAGLTLLRWWFAERAELGLAPFGGFDDWSRIVREPLVALGLGDPVATRAAVLESDTEAQEVAAVLEELAKLPQPFTARSAVQHLNGIEGERRFTPTTLGYYLRGIKHRPEGGRKLIEAGQSHGGARAWRVVPCSG